MRNYLLNIVKGQNTPLTSCGETKTRSDIKRQHEYTFVTLMPTVILTFELTTKFKITAYS